MHTRTTVLALGIFAGSALAGTVDIGATLSDNSQFITNFHAANPGHATNVNRIASVTSGNQMNFTAADFNGFGNSTFDVDVSASDSLNFFLGDVANLYGGTNDNWFNGGGASRPVDGTLVLAFGNTQSATNSNEVVLDFNPGVTSFGFNYDDLEPATLTVIFQDDITGDLSTQNIAANSAQGFISFVAGAGESIDSIVLRQNSGSSFNDGFSFYDFQTIQVVPLPAPLFAGLGLLGGLGIARRIRRS